MILTPLTLLVVGIAAGYDYMTRRIPNFLTFPAIILGLGLNAYYYGFPGLGNGALGMLLGIALLLIPFFIGGMGAGDVKLLAAVGAINGTAFVLTTFIYSALIGGIMSIIAIILKRQFKATMSNMFLFMVPGAKMSQPKTGIPYGIAIFLGTILSFYTGVIW
ncbi:Type IV prepilin peptidase TadV/CpaA [Candidatus Syntrophocurvum alkaliphilum]|uniref:Type IV prepilin peptidase TadV/CpaA n=1 Tax=Candidatus Syntrophocurvum alkaliphilum TaxID=2293317 RepID=A0A6I6DCG2_9FIRM|nr:prepilin peptidase [Candidatus Syntrophocurvum alkaliphilum]QGU00288.1 Type IV prepilin peptidase TadV/CpaA [Candidatus Syntrophocurvum alkaliphilum]